jgi:hypothetical protein
VKRPLAALGMMALITAPAAAGHAQAQGTIKVAVELRQAGTQSRETVQGGGRVVITEKGGVRPRGSLGARATETRVRQSTGIFTLVQDGGEARLTVATQVPYPEVVFYRDYATGAGYLASGVTFRDVGTALTVRASILPGNQVRVRLTPTLSHFSPDGSGTIELTEAATELVVGSGRPVVLGGTATRLHEVTRRILGVDERRGGTQTTIVLIATVQ